MATVNPVELYKKARIPHRGISIETGSPYVQQTRARDAWQGAKHSASVINRWNELNGLICEDDYDLRLSDDSDHRTVRLCIVPDDTYWTIDDLIGDPQGDIPDSRWKRYVDEQQDRVDRDGIWGIIGEYYNGEEWEPAYSCWGFIGDDWQGSDYDLDAMSLAIDEYDAQEHCPCCGRPKCT